MAKKIQRKDVPDIARGIVELYSATMRIPDKPTIKKGKFEHLDKTLDPTPGWWVECMVFVSEDTGD